MTQYGASGICLMLIPGGNGPTNMAIGTGSAAVTSGRSGLMCEVSRKEFSSTDTTVQKEFGMIADWGSMDVSGLTITEFAVFSTGSPWAIDTTQLANPGFESGFTSGTNWYKSTGTNFFSGAQDTAWKTSGTYSALLSWFSGASSGFASGQAAFLSQKMNFSGLYQIMVDFKMHVSANQFQGEIYVGSVMLGSIYTTTAMDISGTKIYGVNQIGTGSYDLKLQIAAISGTTPVSGLYQMWYDNIRTLQYSGGTAWSLNGFRGISFDGTNELQIQDTYKVQEV